MIQSEPRVARKIQTPSSESKDGKQWGSALPPRDNDDVNAGPSLPPSSALGEWKEAASSWLRS